MKKLMIAACAVAFAAAAQAASCDWGVSSKTVQDKSGANYAGVQYYLVNTSAASWNQTAVIAALTDGTLTAADLASQAYFVENKQGSTSSKSAGSVSSHAVSNAGFTDQGEYALAYIIFDTNDGKDYFLISAAETATAYDPGKEGKGVMFAGSDFTGGTGWTEVTGGSGDVPEPTSAMLLLLGVAGLALRRRRA